MRYFLSLPDLDVDILQHLLRRAHELKAGALRTQSLSAQVLALLFEHPSTRTRLSFEVAMARLGGTCVFMAAQDSQLQRGELIEDTARVFTQMVDAVVLRISSHASQQRFAECSDIPVINGLSDRFHPCQLLADIMTYEELRGSIRGRRVAWVGAGSNVCQSWINASALFDFQLAIAAPAEFRPEPELLTEHAGHLHVGDAPFEAVRDADLVVTDVWSSMGQEQQADVHRRTLAAFQVDERLMREARSDALFMHCLPAHRGEEVSAGVIDGPQSVVWREAGNRMYAQQALLEWLLHR